MIRIIKKIKTKGYNTILQICNSFCLLANKKNIKAFKNRYSGKRCFIIGNGPSLTIEDLELLKNSGEICFATHRIYHIFSKTDWKPDFYCAQDYKLICESFDEIRKMKVKFKFIGIVTDLKYPNMGDIIGIHLDAKDSYPQMPDFSDDICNRIFEGFTVSYMCIQIAAYMGFKEIILLGIDHSYSAELNPDGTIKNNEGINDHFCEKDKVDNLPQLYKSTLAYKKAKEYADEHQIKIYNATRGGRLEIFERKALEDVVNISC